MVSSFDLGLLVMVAAMLAAVVHRRALHRKLAPVAGEIRYEPVVVLPSIEPDPDDFWTSVDPESSTAAPKERHERVVGLVGLIVMVSFGATLLALTLYESGSVAARLISRMMHSAG
jgi:hypothetical protein